MNSLIKKVMSLILVLILTAAVFSGCGTVGAKAIAAPNLSPNGQVLQSSGIQSLTTESTAPETTEPETTEPEATEPEATEPEATEPEAPAGEDFFQQFLDYFLKFFEWFRVRVNYVFDVLIKNA
jgi:hypothetical protein